MAAHEISAIILSVEQTKFFTLADFDRRKLDAILKKGGAGRLISRALTLKMKDQQYTNMQIAHLVSTTPRTVINTYMAYVDLGLDRALNDDPRPGQPPHFDDRVKAQIVAMVCADPPEGFDRWTLNLLQEKVIEREICGQISAESIRIILREHDIKPWQYKMWCVPKLDDEYIRRMEDILDIYAKDYDPQRPVVCVDEKPVTIHGDARPMTACKPGSPKKIDYEYTREGTANVFCAVEPSQGVYINEVTESKKGVDFARFLEGIARKYESAEKIVLVMDNYSTHGKKGLVEFYGEEQGIKIWERFEAHYTPTHASWLNQAEIAIGMYSRQCLGHCRMGDMDNLKRKTQAWNMAINQKNVTIKWKFSTDDARVKFKYSEKINLLGH